MHGRNRAEYKSLQQDAKVVAKLSAKAIAWHQLQAALLHRVRTGEATTGTLSLIESAVTVNPDPIWLWNYRRNLLEQKTTIDAAITAEPNAEQIWEREQAVTQTALTGNPKAYAAWHHRKCCLQTYIVTVTKDSNQQQRQHQTATTDHRIEAVLQFELNLTATLFQRDERNFHCWSYRRYIVSCRLWYAQRPLHPAVSANTVEEPPNGEWNLDCVTRTNANGTAVDESSTVWMSAQLAAVTSTATADVNDITTNTNTHTNSLETESTTPTVDASTQIAAVDAILFDEWNFCGTKIRDNFSNCSAFHYRSKLLPLMVAMLSTPSSTLSTSSKALIESVSAAAAHSDSGTTPGQIQALISLEMELIANVIFTEPDDQTVWWYQYFLLDFIVTHEATTACNAHGWYHDHLVQPHTDQLRELRQETQSRSKWVLIGLEQCLDYSQRLLRLSTSSTLDPLSAHHVEERRGILQALVELDSDRHHRYRYLLRQL